MTHHDDPKLTAFALGELDDAERAALEGELDEAARAEVEAIQEIGSLLEQGLGAEPCPALEPEQRAAIGAGEPAGADAPPPVIKLRPWYARPGTWAAAAGLLLAGGLGFTVTQTPDASRAPAFVDVAAGDLADAGPAPAGTPAPQREAREFVDAHGDEPAAYESTWTKAEERALRRRDARRQAEAEQLNAGRRPAPEPAAPAETTAGAPAPEPPRTPPVDAEPRPPAQDPADAFMDLSEAEADHAAEPPSGERYQGPPENDFVELPRDPEYVRAHPESVLSTFSIDVDTASYANVRRFLSQQYRLPPPAAVRIEELVNYFDYDYAGPEGDVPFAVHADVAACPWNEEHRLVRVGLKGKEVAYDERPASNLVFLLDVSGSMRAANKLPLLKNAMKMLTEQLDERDRVTIVVYAGASGLVLPPTRGDRYSEIMGALDRLRAGGSTNGGAGIQLAYRKAAEHYVEGGVNRVILATDGDFNVAASSHSALIDLIEEKARSGVYLTVLGLGMGNLNDHTLEQIADKGNGNYAYIDTLREAQKVLVDDMSGTLQTIAKDVKIQVDFNYQQVKAYRLIGYENRALAAEDFNDDTKDAGEIGAGHTVTALYEVVPVGASGGVEPSRYGPAADPAEGDAPASPELLTVRLNYKLPENDAREPTLYVPVEDPGRGFWDASSDFRFAASVAAFGMLLRGSEHDGDATYRMVREIASESRGEDPRGFRAEFLELVTRAEEVDRRR